MAIPIVCVMKRDLLRGQLLFDIAAGLSICSTCLELRHTHSSPFDYYCSKPMGKPEELRGRERDYSFYCTCIIIMMIIKEAMLSYT